MKALFPEPHPGLITWAEPKKAVWMQDAQSGRCAQIGVYDPSIPGAGNKMVLCPAGFPAVGIPAVCQCEKETAEWFTIDEIGYLETDCPDYCDAIRRLMACRHVAAVVRNQELPFLRELVQRKDAFVVDLDAPYGKLGCVIMASGLGKRFGSNKLMADFQGEPMIARALSATDGIFERRVVVTRHREVAELCKERGVEVLLHDYPQRADTVRLGLEAVGDTAGCLFCPGDQPLLQQETVAALALAAVNCPAAIWRTSFGDTPGSPVLFPQWTFPELSALPRGFGGGYVAKKYPRWVRTIPVRNPKELMDVDSPKDLQALAEQ